MTIELLNGLKVAVHPLGAGGPLSAEELALKRALTELTLRGAALPPLERRRLGRRLVHGAVMRALPAETPASLEGLCHLGHVEPVAAALKADRGPGPEARGAGSVHVPGIRREQEKS